MIARHLDINLPVNHMLESNTQSLILNVYAPAPIRIALLSNECLPQHTLVILGVFHFR